MTRIKRLTKEEMEKVFKPIILKEIAKLEEEIKKLSEDTLSDERTSVYSLHVADVSGEIYEKEFSAGLLSKEYKMLSALRYALEKIDQGNYGLCESCGQPIPKGRLKIMPAATLCINCENLRQKDPNKAKKIF